ncbi:MAG: suppressor of fused domain protein [Planctomycetota bacterium]
MAASDPPDWDREIERTGSGDPILRHEAGSEPPEIAHGDGSLIDAVDKHVEEHLGSIAMVFHELVSPTVHLDVHVIAPSDERPVWTLVTSGMAERPMREPDGVEGCQFAELTLSLPADWPGLGDEFMHQSTDDPDHPFRDEKNYWPMRTLKYLARFPYEFNTWVWYGHSFPNGEPPEPYAPSVSFVGAVLFPSMLRSSDTGYGTIRAGDRDISLFGIWPLYPEELQFKLDHGTDKLIDRFEAAGLAPPEIIDIHRPNVCAPKRKKWFGLF